MRIPVESYHLPNGLHVVLSEDHTAPIVAVNLWYHVGSANERLERTGFAHLFEHMLFQGSANVEANEHFELVQRAGGTLNGRTTTKRCRRIRSRWRFGSRPTGWVACCRGSRSRSSTRNATS